MLIDAKNKREQPVSIFCLGIPQNMSLTAYPIDLKHINTREEDGNE
jgi:hypothetical protein